MAALTPEEVRRVMDSAARVGGSANLDYYNAAPGSRDALAAFMAGPAYGGMMPFVGGDPGGGVSGPGSFGGGGGFGDFSGGGVSGPGGGGVGAIDQSGGRGGVGTQGGSRSGNTGPQGDFGPVVGGDINDQTFGSQSSTVGLSNASNVLGDYPSSVPTIGVQTGLGANVGPGGVTGAGLGGVAGLGGAYGGNVNAGAVGGGGIGGQAGALQGGQQIGSMSGRGFNNLGYTDTPFGATTFGTGTQQATHDVRGNPYGVDVMNPNQGWMGTPSAPDLQAYNQATGLLQTGPYSYIDAHSFFGNPDFDPSNPSPDFEANMSDLSSQGFTSDDIAGLAADWGVSLDSAAALAAAGFNGEDFGGFGGGEFGGGGGGDDGGGGDGGGGGDDSGASAAADAAAADAAAADAASAADDGDE